MTKRFENGMLVFLKQPFGKSLSGWCVIKMIDIPKKKVAIWFAGQDFDENRASVPFHLLREATEEEMRAYLLSIFSFDPLTAVVIAHDNQATELLALSLIQSGLTNAKIAAMPSFQSLARVLQDATLFQSFLEIVEKISTKKE